MVVDRVDPESRKRLSFELNVLYFKIHPDIIGGCGPKILLVVVDRVDPESRKRLSPHKF